MKPVFKCSWRDAKLPEVTVTEARLSNPGLLPVLAYRVERVLLGLQIGEYLFLNPRPVIENVRAIWQPDQLQRTTPVSTIVVAVKDDYTWQLFAREAEAALADMLQVDAPRQGFSGIESHLWRWLERHGRWVHYNYRGGTVPQTDWQVRGEDNKALLGDAKPCLPMQSYAQDGYTFYFVEKDGQRYHVAIDHEQLMLYRSCYRRLHPLGVEWNSDDFFLASNPSDVVCAYPVSRLRPYSFWSLLDLGVQLPELLEEFAVVEHPNPRWQCNVASYDPYNYFSKRST